MKFHVIAAVLLAGASVGVVAQDTGAAGQEDGAASEAASSEGIAALAAAVEDSAGLNEDPADQEVQCRTERITGSLTRRRRTCMTVAEWRDLEAATYHGVSNMNRNASGGRECRQDQFGGC